MEYAVRIKRLSSHPLAVVRRRATAAELAIIVPAACGTVWDVIQAQKIEGVGRNVAIYLDDEINLEVGVELDVPFEGLDEVVGSTLPAGTVATLTHFGPYDLLHKAHRVIRQWCADRDYRLIGPNWEIYGHWIDEWNRDPAKILTDVFYLVE